MNDMQHNGGWTSPVASQDYIIVPSSEGFIHRFSRETGYHDNLWKYPNGEVSLGAFYGDMIIKDGVLYGSSYGDGQGKKCQSRNCVSNIFAVDIISGNSIWSEGSVRLETSIVGGVIIYSENTLVFATSENDNKDGIGSYIYALDIESDSDKSLRDRIAQRILWKVPVKGKIFGKPLLHEDLAIVGTMSGSLIAIDLRNNQDLVAKGEDQYLFNDPKRLLMDFDLGSPIISSPVDVGNKLCFGDITGQFKCIEKKQIDIAAKNRLKTNKDDLNTKNLFSSLKLDGWVWSTPIVYNEVVYATTLSGNIYAINVDSDKNASSIIWVSKAEYKGKPVGSSIIFDHSGQKSLAIPFDKDTVGIVDIVTGGVLGEFPVDEGVAASPLVVDNLLYVIDREGRVKTFSARDRTLVRCFDLEKLEGCK